MSSAAWCGGAAGSASVAAAAAQAAPRGSAPAPAGSGACSAAFTAEDTSEKEIRHGASDADSGMASEAAQEAGARSCSRCGEAAPQRCPCRRARYCGRKCQAAHWGEHKPQHDAAMAERAGGGAAGASSSAGSHGAAAAAGGDAAGGGRAEAAASGSGGGVVRSTPDDPDAVLRSCGYAFNRAGQMRQVDRPDQGFKWTGQEDYDRLGEAVLDAIQARMRGLGLSTVWVGAAEGSGPAAQTAGSRSFVSRAARRAAGGAGLDAAVLMTEKPSHGAAADVWVSDDVTTNDGTMLVLIHGSGAVRPGQWARKLCMNDSLDDGSMLPMIRNARERGFSVVVASPNVNIAPNGAYIPGSETSTDHAATMWRLVVQPSPARHIVVVAHSAGGAGAIEIVRSYCESCPHLSSGIALTSSPLTLN